MRTDNGNLRVPTSEEARIIGRKGGLASAKARAERKTLKEELLAILSDGDFQNRMSLAIIQKACKGDTKAFEVIRSTIGEDEAKKIEVDVPTFIDDM